MIIHFCRTLAKVNMYIYINLGVNWTINVGDMAKVLLPILEL